MLLEEKLCIKTGVGNHQEQHQTSQKEVGREQ